MEKTPCLVVALELKMQCTGSVSNSKMGLNTSCSVYNCKDFCTDCNVALSTCLSVDWGLEGVR